jgi:hypothetical protein
VFRPASRLICGVFGRIRVGNNHEGWIPFTRLLSNQHPFPNLLGQIFYGSVIPVFRGSGSNVPHSYFFRRKRVQLSNWSGVAKPNQSGSPGFTLIRTLAPSNRAVCGRSTAKQITSS